MKIVRTSNELRAALGELRGPGKTLGLVPTMGCLHDGHISLVKQTRLQAKITAATIFVNPTQFNDKKDLEKYPVNLENDFKLLEAVGTHLVFVPASADEVYSKGFQTWVSNDELSNLWEGASRPGHFRGVTTVVSILFNLFRPDLAIFGEKDFQQLRIIERMVEDLRLGVRIVRGTLIREVDGLAMSSRNVRLSSDGRRKALCLSRAAKVARDAFVGGQRSAPFLQKLARDMLDAEIGVRPDYVALVDENTLQPLTGNVAHGRLLIAATVDGLRLLDNVELG